MLIRRQSRIYFSIARGATDPPAPLSRVFASIAKSITNHNLKNPFLKNLYEKSFNRSHSAALRGEHCHRANRCYSWAEPHTIHFSNARHCDGGGGRCSKSGTRHFA